MPQVHLDTRVKGNNLNLPNLPKLNRLHSPHNNRPNSSSSKDKMPNSNNNVRHNLQLLPLLRVLRPSPLLLDLRLGITRRPDQTLLIRPLLRLRLSNELWEIYASLRMVVKRKPLKLL